MSNVETRALFEVWIDTPVEVWQDNPLTDEGDEMASWTVTPKYVHLYAVDAAEATAQATANLKPGESIHSVTQIAALAAAVVAAPGVVTAKALPENPGPVVLLGDGRAPR